MKKSKPGEGCIYLITNLVNGKKYTGKDKSGDPASHRWKDHIWLALTGRSKCPVHCAMRKAYKRDGCWKTFKFEIIWIGPIEKLCKKEVYYVKKLHTYNRDPLGNRSYNMTLGGEGTGGHKWSKKSRKTLSEQRKHYCEDLTVRARMSAIQMQPETRKKRSASLKRYFETSAAREKISKSMKRHFKEDPAARVKTGKVTKKVWAAKTHAERAEAGVNISAGLAKYWAKPGSREKAHKKTSAAGVRSWITRRANEAKKKGKK